MLIVVSTLYKSPLLLLLPESQKADSETGQKSQKVKKNISGSPVQNSCILGKFPTGSNENVFFLIHLECDFATFRIQTLA